MPTKEKNTCQVTLETTALGSEMGDDPAIVLHVYTERLIVY